MNGAAVALELLRLAALASPLIGGFLRDAVSIMSGDPRARSVAEVLPAESASRDVERQIRARQAALEEYERTGNVHAALDAQERGLA